MLERIKQFLLDWWRGYRGILGATRSPSWSSVRKTYITQNPLCAVCGKNGTLLKANEVHHKQSYATRPDLELLESNLITGCREHHQWFFHFGSWQSINENIEEDVKVWSEKIKNRPGWDGVKWIYPNHENPQRN